MQKYIIALVAVFIMAMGAEASASPQGRAAKAADCAHKIVIVLDAENNDDQATVDETLPTMSQKCLTIGGAAEDDLATYDYTDEEVLKRMVVKVRSAYHVSVSRFWDAYSVYDTNP